MIQIGGRGISGEDAGKSTQIERLEGRLKRLSQPVLVTREPGGSPYADEIRAFILGGQAKRLGPFAEALLFAAARIDHLDKTIKPTLKGGTHVLCDRFAKSTPAYQGSLGNLDKGLIDQLETVTLQGIKPSLTFILDLPAEIVPASAGARQVGKGEEEDISFHQSLRQAYLSLARAKPERCVVIDADREPDEVEAAIWAALHEHLPQITEHATRSLDVA